MCKWYSTVERYVQFPLDISTSDVKSSQMVKHVKVLVCTAEELYCTNTLILVGVRNDFQTLCVILPWFYESKNLEHGSCRLGTGTGVLCWTNNRC